MRLAVRATSFSIIVSRPVLDPARYRGVPGTSYRPSSDDASSSSSSSSSSFAFSTETVEQSSSSSSSSATRKEDTRTRTATSLRVSDASDVGRRTFVVKTLSRSDERRNAPGTPRLEKSSSQEANTGAWSLERTPGHDAYVRKRHARAFANERTNTRSHHEGMRFLAYSRDERERGNPTSTSPRPPGSSSAPRVS